MLMDMACTAGMSPEVTITKPRNKRVSDRGSAASRRTASAAIAA